MNSAAQNISDPTFGTQLMEDWEENFWASLLSPRPNTSTSTSTHQPQISAAIVKTHLENKTIPRSQHCQMQISTPHRNTVSNPILTPATSRNPATCTNASTYFTTFNPSSQYQRQPMYGRPAGNILNATVNNRIPHQARINLVPTGNGNFKVIVKRKRKRINFTTEQVQVLENVFSKKPYITRDERKILVQHLQVNDKSIKVWFQNRRLKIKKEEQEEREYDNQCSISERLDSLEAKIKERTNENGYVILDDIIMDDLVNVVDKYFMTKASLAATPATETASVSGPIYEPISPTSTSENSSEENSVSW